MYVRSGQEVDSKQALKGHIGDRRLSGRLFKSGSRVMAETYYFLDRTLKQTVVPSAHGVPLSALRPTDSASVAMPCS